MTHDQPPQPHGQQSPPPGWQPSEPQNFQSPPYGQQPPPPGWQPSAPPYFQPPPYSQQPPPPGLQAPKKNHTVRNVFIVLGILAVMGLGGCLAFVGAIGNEMNKAHTVVYEVTGTAA